MSKTSRFRAPFDNEHPRVSQTLLKSRGQPFHYIFSWLRGKLNCKMSVPVTSEILGLFLNTLTAMKSILFIITRSFSNQFRCNYQRKKKCYIDFLLHFREAERLLQPIQMQLSKRQKTFSQFFAAFLKSISNFELLKEKTITLIAYVFSKLKTTKDVVS